MISLIESPVRRLQYAPQPSTVAGRSYSAFAATTAEGAVATSGHLKPTMTFFDRATGLEDKLFNSRAAFKIATATVAMHLQKDWRDQFFKQIDALLDEQDWDPDDLPIESESSKTFLRLILFLKAERRPSLGATHDGNLVAAWTYGKNRLTLVCLPNDLVRWVVSIELDNGERETAAGTASITRIPEVLQPFRLSLWLANAR